MVKLKHVDDVKLSAYLEIDLNADTLVQEICTRADCKLITFFI